MNERLEEIRGRLQQPIDAGTGAAELVRAYKVANADRKYLLAELDKIRVRHDETSRRITQLEQACASAVEEMELFDLRQTAWDACRRAIAERHQQASN